VLAGAVPPHLQCRVIAAMPVDNQVQHLVAHAHNDLIDEASDDPVARRSCCTRTFPSSLEFGIKRK
jgi:hypothetical protein